MHPLCGGIPPALAWEHLELVAKRVLPALASPHERSLREPRHEEPSRAGASASPAGPSIRCASASSSTSGCPTSTCRRCTWSRSCSPSRRRSRRATRSGPSSSWSSAPSRCRRTAGRTRSTGLRRLREAGCVGVIGPLVSDNARTLRDAINQRDPASLCHLGGHLRLVRRLLLPARQRRLHRGRRADGLAGSRTAGIRRIGVMSEISPNGQEYFLAFRRAAAELGLEIRGVETITQTPDGPRAAPREPARRRRRGPRLHGLRLPDLADAADLRAARLGSAAHHDHRLPVLLREPGLDEGARRLGRDRPGLRGESALRALPRALREALGLRPHHPNTVPVLAYDSARVFTEAIRRCRRRAHRPGREGRPRAHALRAERTRAARAPTSAPRPTTTISSTATGSSTAASSRRAIRPSPSSKAPSSPTCRSAAMECETHELRVRPLLLRDRPRSVSALPAHARRGARLLQPAPRLLGADALRRTATTPSSTGRPTRRRRGRCSS